ncbi:MAG: HipA domain-containing protein [Saprospiraceae bacterium]|jgi:serine/threonine-protein kinase HipA|nr:HipA domain-containing protein [Saprospiraceae bacterium]
MNICPITYQPCGSNKYSERGLKLLHRSLSELYDFPLTAPEQRLHATGAMAKMSIQGMQPKLSAVLNLRKKVLETVETGGVFIIKPQHETYLQMPENEDLTMKMAAIVGIETPVHGLVWCKDGSLSYLIRRFDRTGRNGKLATEDFAQLAGMTRDSKYDYTIEKMVKLIEQHCTFPQIEKFKFFRLVLFCFLTGNEDMHLKNFSLITRNGKVEFSPAYDLLNSTLVLGGTTEEMALMLAGRRKEFRKKELVDYFGMEKLGLPEAAIQSVLADFKKAQITWENLIATSFLTANQKQDYRELLAGRMARLFKK